MSFCLIITKISTVNAAVFAIWISYLELVKFSFGNKILIKQDSLGLSWFRLFKTIVVWFRITGLEMFTIEIKCLITTHTYKYKNTLHILFTYTPNSIYTCMHIQSHTCTHHIRISIEKSILVKQSFFSYGIITGSEKTYPKAKRKYFHFIFLEIINIISSL